MKRIIAAVFGTVLLSSFIFALPWQEVTGTDYECKGPRDFVLGSAYGRGTSNVLVEAPFGGYHTAYTNIGVVYILEAGDGVCKVRPRNKARAAQPLAVFIKQGAPKTVMLDGGKDSKTELLYVYAEGNLTKLKLKGFGSVGKIAVSNTTEGCGIVIKNTSKAAAGGHACNIHTVITTGKIKQLISKKGGFGGTAQIDPGAISIGTASPSGRIKAGPKAEMAHLLFCGGLAGGGYNYSEAYAECWTSQQVVNAVVNMGTIGSVKTKAMGPAVFGMNVGKKYKDATKIKVTDVVGLENLVDNL